jgi:16S rRNA (guanine966-N2)-methyltransferase
MKKHLKLTGGSFGGRRLHVPVSGVRPATNRVREAIFSTLNSFFERGVEGLKVLDLFAGSGSLGLEARSRGAKDVTFVERDFEAVKAIKKNLEMLGYSATIIRDDVINFLKKSRALDCDLIFMDPPYMYERCAEAVELLKRAIQPGHRAVLVHERFYEETLPDFGSGIELLKRKKYGQTEILYYLINV